MATEPAHPARVWKLLVVDDSEVHRLVLGRSLEQAGHHVASVESGQAAIDRLRLERFDLLLLDLEMPAMDGFALLEQRAVDPALREVAVIVTSSLDGQAVAARCAALGADAYLYKPVDPQVLVAKVREILDHRRQGGGDDKALN